MNNRTEDEGLRTERGASEQRGGIDAPATQSSALSTQHSLDLAARLETTTRERDVLLAACEGLLPEVRECNTQNPEWLALEECPAGHELECGRCYALRQARALVKAGRS